MHDQAALYGENGKKVENQELNNGKMVKTKSGFTIFLLDLMQA